MSSKQWSQKFNSFLRCCTQVIVVLQSLSANSLTAGNATITSKAETDAALSNVTVQAGKISATSTANGTRGSISNADVQIAQLAQDASFTILIIFESAVSSPTLMTSICI